MRKAPVFLSGVSKKPPPTWSKIALVERKDNVLFMHFDILREIWGFTLTFCDSEIDKENRVSWEKGILVLM